MCLVTKERSFSRVFVADLGSPELYLKSLEKRFLFPGYIERDKSTISNAIYFACQKWCERNLFRQALEETIIAGQPGLPSRGKYEWPKRVIP